MTGRRIAFSVGVLAFLLSVWPLLPGAARVRPFVAGMPFSMFWLVLMIAIVFFTFLALFVAERRIDLKRDRRLDESARSGAEARERSRG